MNEETLQLFKTLTELPGAPGNEHAVRAFMRSELEKYSDEIVQDNLGGIFGVKRSEVADAPKVLVAGHMDEVAFMVTSITDNGMIRFQTLGGWWNQVMLAQRVEVYTKNGAIPGVVSSIPPHLLTDAERAKPMDIKICLSMLALTTKKMQWVWVFDQDNLSFLFVHLHQWPIRKKLWLRLGITVMAVV